MAGRDDSTKSRTVTDKTLRTERDRADDEVLERSTALGETAEDVIRIARERARAVLALARRREDETLDAAKLTDEQRAHILDERDAADELVTMEYAVADAQVSDELSERRRAIIRLLALERGDTDRVLARERRASDSRVADRDDLLGSVSHDLRNQLSAMLVSTSVLILQHPNDARLIEIVRGMQTSMAQMDHLVGSFLDVASIEGGRSRVARTLTDLAAIVAEEVNLHRPVAESRSITLTLDTPTDAISVEVDAQAISRVLLNVLGNALKYTPVGGSVRVCVERDGEQALISVTDTGPGIAAERLDSIFDRFKREDTTKRGYGLGLYIARAIVTAHGGRIWAESTLGAGTTFKIELPTLA